MKFLFLIVILMTLSACSTQSLSDGMAKYNNTMFGARMDVPTSKEQTERFFKLLQDEGEAPALEYWKKISDEKKPNSLVLETTIDGNTKRYQSGEVKSQIKENNTALDVYQVCKNLESFEEQFYCLVETEKAPCRLNDSNHDQVLGEFNICEVRQQGVEFKLNFSEKVKNSAWVNKKGRENYLRLLSETIPKISQLSKDRATFCKNKNLGDVFLVRAGVFANLGGGYYKANILNQKKICTAPKIHFLYNQDQIIKTAVEMPRFSCQTNALLIYGGQEKFKSHDGFATEAPVWKIVEGKELAKYSALKAPKSKLEENCIKSY